MTQHPEMFWAIVTSMFVGNCILLGMMLPLIRYLAKITLVPNSFLVPIIVLACLAGAYGVNNNATDITSMTAFGVLGYLMRKFDFPPPRWCSPSSSARSWKRRFAESLICPKATSGSSSTAAYPVS